MIKKIWVYIALAASCFFALAGCSGNTPVSTNAPGGSETYTEIITQLEGDGQSLDAVLTMPKTSGKPPVVIMIQGSGPSDKDETIGPNKPFADIAHGLAQRGVASFRFDKRTFSYPEEFNENPTIQGEVLADAALAVKQMKADKSLGNVYILGHSLGGMMAPQIARENPDVAGVIILAGSPRGLEDIMYDQNMAVLETADLSQSQKEEALQIVNESVNAIKNLQPGDTGDVFGVPASYWISLNEIDTPTIADRLSIPIFIMQGDADFQVSVENDYNAWKELLDGKDNVSFKLYNGLNHLFMPSTGAMDATEYEEASVVDPQVIEDIATFIKEHEKSAQPSASQ